MLPAHGLVRTTLHPFAAIDFADSGVGLRGLPRRTREQIVAMILHMTNRHPRALLVSPGGEIRPPEDEMAELWGWFMAAGGRYESGGEWFPMVACPLTRLIPQEELRARLGSEERVAAFTQRIRTEIKENTEVLRGLAREGGHPVREPRVSRLHPACEGASRFARRMNSTLLVAVALILSGCSCAIPAGLAAVGVAGAVVMGDSFHAVLPVADLAGWPVALPLLATDRFTWCRLGPTPRGPALVRQVQLEGTWPVCSPAAVNVSAITGRPAGSCPRQGPNLSPREHQGPGECRIPGLLAGFSDRLRAGIRTSRRVERHKQGHLPCSGPAILRRVADAGDHGRACGVGRPVERGDRTNLLLPTVSNARGGL